MKTAKSIESGYVIITGASSGIGKAIALDFARRGQGLILVARREDRLLQLQDEIKKIRSSHLPPQILVADLVTPEGVEKLSKFIANLPISGLVNNAGVGDLRRFDLQPWDLQDNMIQLNMTSLTHLTSLLLPQMREQKFGRILNVASTAAFQPGPYFAVYSATKAYVLSLSLALNEELKGSGVSVTVLCPGMTESEFHSHADTGRAKGLAMTAKASAESVAAAGVDAMLNGQAKVVTGMMNKMMVMATRLTTLKLSAKIAGKVLKPQDKI